MNHPKVFFINDSSANTNWGSQATSVVLKKLIKDAKAEIVASLPLAELNHANWNTSTRKANFYTKSLAVLPSNFLRKAAKALLNRLVIKLPDICPKDWSEFEEKAQQVMQGKILSHVKEALESCDLVIINGEGGILENQRESRMMFFLAYLAKKYFNKPVALVNHTASLEQAVLKEIAQHVYPLIDDSVFRDLLSFKTHANLGNSSLAADVTFTLEPAGREDWLKLASRPFYFDIAGHSCNYFDVSKPFICLGGSSVFSARHKQNSSPKQALEQLALALTKVAPVVLVASAKADEEILLSISKKLSLAFVSSQSPFMLGLDLLANSSLYVGGRWHGAIFALLGGTPTVTFAAETFKLDALMQSFELAKPFDALSLEHHVADIAALAEQYLEQDGLRLKLKNKASKLSLSVTEQIKLLNTFKPTAEEEVAAD